MTIKIRLATPEDASVITDFNIKMALETEEFHLDYHVVSKGVRSLLADTAKGLYYVAHVQEASKQKYGYHQPIAQIAITYEWSDWRNGNWWWIQSVYVMPEYRQRGVFKALYKHVCAAAKDAGGCGVRLYADAGNEIAHEVYRKMGMKSHYIVFEQASKHFI